MTTRSHLLRLALLLTAAFLLAGIAAADTPGAVQQKVAAQAAPARPVQAPPPGKPLPDLAAMTERVDALEKENTVLREDLGKARLDARTQLAEHERRNAETRDRLQQKIDALQAELEAEREAQAKRNRNFWIAAGVLAVGIIVAAD